MKTGNPVVLENKLGLTNSAELAKQEELLTKKRAKELFESGKIEDLEIGTFQGLSDIHQFLFQDIYDFAGKIREVNIAKGNFQFAPRIFLAQTLEYIDKLPQETFDEIIDKFLARHGIQAKSVWKAGNVGETIATYAEAGKFDMLVMGSHGHGSFLNMVLGSVATKVLANCKTPVLLVR